MEKINLEAKKRYAEKIKEYKHKIEGIQAKCKSLENEIREMESSAPIGETPATDSAPAREPGMEGGPKAPALGSQESSSGRVQAEGPNYKRLDLANEQLNLLSYYILMNALSLSLLGIKNEGYLNEARKCCYKCIICLEEVVTPSLDVPFSEYAPNLFSIDAFDDRAKYGMLKKLGFSIDAVVEGFGENSKWKWSFVELRGRYAVVTKNLINLKSFMASLDPRVEGYAERQAHLKLVKQLLQRSSDRYREKYELSTLRLDDIKKAIAFLSALRRLHVLFGEAEEAEVIKRKVDIWKTKMESDQKKMEQARKLEKLKKKT